MISSASICRRSRANRPDRQRAIVNKILSQRGGGSIIPASKCQEEAAMSRSDVEIVECTTPKQRDEFIFFQWVPYKGNPYWCPPLISERREFYDPARHPFHQHADVAMRS